MIPLEHGHGGEALVQDVGRVLRERDRETGKIRRLLVLSQLVDLMCQINI